MSRAIKLGASLLIILAFTGCEDSPTQYQPDRNPDIVESSFGEASLGEETSVVPEDILNEITDISDDGTVFTFSNVDGDPYLESLEEGNILVVGVSEKTPNGALRKIEGIDRESDSVILSTVETSMEEAFENLDLVYNEPLEASNVEKIVYKVPSQDIREVYTRESHPKMLETSFKYDIDQVFFESEDDENLKVKLEGYIELKPTVDFRTKIRDANLEELRIAMLNELNSNLEISAGVSRTLENEQVLVSYTFGVIIIGWVIIRPVLEIVIGIEGEANVGISTNVDMVIESNAGVEYSNEDWRPLSDFSTDYSGEMPTIDSDASLGAYAGPQVNFLIYGITGPYVNLVGFGEAAIDMNRTPELQVHAGVRANAGVIMDIFSLIRADFSVPDLYSNSVLVFERSLSGRVTLNTLEASSVSENSAVLGGEITDEGTTIITDRGVCWGKSKYPDENNGTCKSSEEDDNIFTVEVDNLELEEKYYMRAFATNSMGTFYGSNKDFRTVPDISLPTVSTKSISSITPTMAEGGGNVTDSGGGSITQRGVCWSTSLNPNRSDHCTEDGTGGGVFTSNLRGMSPETTYYVRAYAENSMGTAYGNRVSFTTNEADERDEELHICDEWSASQSGGAGVTIDNWDISELPTGVTFDMEFDAYNIPDKFVVEYPIGTERLDTGWRGASSYDGDPDYPGGVESPGDELVEDIFEKKAENIFRVIVTGVDDRTAWEYKVRCRAQ